MTPGGQLMREEIKAQPETIRRVASSAGDVAEIAELIANGSRPVRLVAHGSSDNAAAFGVYAFGLLCGRTAFRDSISLLAYYGARLDVRGDTVLALSQSGETPDVVAYVERARELGALTVGVTNDPGSALACAAELVVVLQAGPERAVAATKTYAASLAALALLAGHAAGAGAAIAEELRRTADVVEETITVLEHDVDALAAAFAYVGRMFVIGRGPELATAREFALKLQETCRIAADAMTATDFGHGPVAAVDPLFPVWAFAAADPVLAGVEEAARRAREIGAALIASGPACDAIADASYRLPTPAATHPLLSPLVSIVPGQLFARSLALARGLDPDAPVGLSKVTQVP